MKIEYTDGNSLKHGSVWRGASSGNGWMDEKGRFGRNPYGTGRVNKYEYIVQGPTQDGTAGAHYYTEAGQRRKTYEESVNAAKKSKNRLDEDALYDTSRWVREDRQGYQDAADAFAKGAKASNNIIDMFNKPKKGARFDLSQMTDQELNSIINRERLERQYDEYFNPPQINKGWEIVKGVNDFALNSAQGFATVMSIINAFKG